MNSLAYVVYKIVSHVQNENENEKHTNNVQTYKRTKWKTGPLNEDQHASQ
jgi:hypothetical protein